MRSEISIAEAEARERKRGTELCGISAADLQRKKFEPVRWAVPQIFVEGLTLFAARPKRGKSWLALNCCTAVASGGYALNDLKCEEGDVLGLFLEDNERRLADRLAQLLPQSEWPQRLTLHTSWPRLDEGGLVGLENWIQSAARPRLIVVDVLAAVRAKANGKNTPYADDYSALKGLHDLAGKHRLAIVVITHDRKAKSEEDILDNVSGTLGLVGAADSAVVLQRREGRADFLYGRGRDMPEFEYAVAFDKATGLWRLLGDANEYRGNQTEIEIIKLLVAAGTPMKTGEIAKIVSGETDAVRVRLDRMAKAGTIRKLAKGIYEAL